MSAAVTVSAPTTVSSLREVFVRAGIFGLVLAELCLGLALVAGWVMVPAFVGAHIVISGLLFLAWWLGRSQAGALMPIGCVILAFTGPMGAAGLVLLSAMMWVSRPSSEYLDAWYQRITGTTHRNEELDRFRNISSGRARGSRLSTVRQFKAILGTGSLEDKQSLLGIIALKYHADFFAVLKSSLRDKEPMVRAQSAAVFAKLRARYKSRFKLALKASGEVDAVVSEMPKKASELFACVRSGFLDAGEIGVARDAIKSMCAGLPAGEEKFELNLVLCDVLLVERDFDEVICRLRPYLGRKDGRAGALISKALVLGARFDELHHLKQAGKIPDTQVGSAG